MRAEIVDPLEILKAFVGNYRRQVDAAEALGITQPWLSKILRGREDVPPKIFAPLGIARAMVKVK